MRICAAPTCSADLDELGLKQNADCCSPACRAAKSRAKRSPAAARSAKFWRAMGDLVDQPHAESPRRQRKRARAR